METRDCSRPHPRPEPRLIQPMTPEGLSQVFRDCVDFKRREIWVNDDPERVLTLCYIEGMARNERVSDYVLRPLAQDERLRQGDEEQMYQRMLHGALYNITAQPCESTDQAASALVIGCAVLFFPEGGRVLSLFTGTEEKRSISPPDNEPAIKGGQDAFVESLRTNTSLVRRHLRAPELRIREHIVGRRSLTPVDVVWLDGIANEDTVARVEARLDQIDIDGVQTTGNLEEYLVDRLNTPFPLIAYTQRPDRFCGGLMEGRVGVLCEGLPMGWLVPGTMDQFFRTGQDKTSNWIVATALSVLRYGCMLVTLLLPALYVAVVTFHPEMIPVKLAASIAAAKQEVPLSNFFEVLVMLLCFEVVQEAGLRLPGPMGQTVSILGGLVVGSAAVEARIVSPAVLIAVALAGVAGYAVPSQDLAAALRLCRLILAILAGLAGLPGLVLGAAGLIIHLAGLESFGVPYLAPFTAGGGAVLRRPLPWDKLRPRLLRTGNRRNQR